MRHNGTQKIQTERLILRRFEADDLTDMFTYWASDPAIQLEYGEPVYNSIEETKKLLKQYLKNYENMDYYRWAIIEKDSRKNIGQIAFCRVYSDCRTAEIEYCIGQNFWGRGYAGEAMQAVIGYTFTDTEFTKLEAYHRAANTKSGRVLEKSQMHITDSVERFRREGIAPDGEVCYCILKDETE